LEAVWEGDLETARPGVQQAMLADVAAGLDGRNLSRRMSYPSCENLCRRIFAELKAGSKGWIRLRVWEGNAKWAEIHEDDPWPADGGEEPA
jgi:hypothetical protein